MRESVRRFVSRVLCVVFACAIILPLISVIEVHAVPSEVTVTDTDTGEQFTYTPAYQRVVGKLDNLEGSPNPAWKNNIMTAVANRATGFEDSGASAFDIGMDMLGALVFKGGEQFDLRRNLPDLNPDSFRGEECIRVYSHACGFDEVESDGVVYSGCDYVVDRDVFRYTLIGAICHGDDWFSAEDDLAIHILESKELVWMDMNLDLDNFWVDWEESSGGIEIIEPDDQGVSNMLNILLNTDSIGSDIERCLDGSIDSDKVESYKKVDELFEYEGGNDRSDQRWLYIRCDKSVSCWMTNNEMTIGEKRTVTDRANHQHSTPGVKSLDSPKVFLSLPLDVSNSDWVNFGDGGAIGPKQHNSDESSVSTLESAYPQTYRTIANILVNVAGCNVDNDNYDKAVQNFLNQLGNGFIYTLVKDFHDAQKDARSEWAINGGKVSEVVSEIGTNGTIDETDPYMIISTIVMYNVACSYNGNEFDNTIAIDGNGNRIHLSTNWKNSKYDGHDGYVNIHYYWEKLTSYQKTAIAVTYKDSFKDGYSEVITGISTYSWLSENEYTESIGEEFSASFSAEDIKGVIEDKDPDLSDTRSIYNIARNSNTLGQYIVGISLYGEGSGNGSIYDVYDATLSSLMDNNYRYSGINDGWYPYTMPDSIPLFGEDGKYFSVLASGGEQGIENFVGFLYNISYAFDVAAFSEGGQGNYDPVALRAYLNGDSSGSLSPVEGSGEQASGATLSWLGGATKLSSLESQASSQDFNCNGDDFSKNMLRSIIELHDLCDFLGMLDDNGSLKVQWTDAIREYLEIYRENEVFFNALRSNQNFFSKAPSAERSVNEPMGMFFNLEEKKMSDPWCMGFAASALFVPMETNLYDAESIAHVTDSEFIADFYYKYAFYRKALYISTDNSAIVNEKVSHTKSGTRVCTLNDLLNYDRDIILYIDDNFYNARDIGEVTGHLDYSAVRNGSKTDTTTSAWETMKDWVGEAFDLSTEQILKTGPVSYYSTTLANNVTKLGHDVTLASKVADVYLLNEDQLLGTGSEKESVFDEYEYTVKVPYAVVSAVYRDEDLYNECLRALATDNAIFKSSRGICSTPGSTSSDWRAIYNYCMLMNLDEQMKNDASSTLDLNAPIFCDIFGNIVTESGLVIIPAATNATLCGERWNPNTVGWSEYYNNGNHIMVGEFSDEVYQWLTGVEYDSNGTINNEPVKYIDHYTDDGEPVYVEVPQGNTDYAYSGLVTGSYTDGVNYKNGGGYFTVDRSGQLILRTSELSGKSAQAIIQWENLNKNSEIIKELFYNDAYYNKAGSGSIYSKRLVNLVVETLRGAPIEYIDYEYEGLSGNIDISKTGVYMAYKLEELTNALISGTNGNSLGGNSVVTMPNLAFVSGIEYIVLYVFKIAFSIMIVGLGVSLYLDAVKNHLGFKSVGKFLVTCGMVIVSITLVPNLISWSYYKANKTMLTDESAYIMMLNYVKYFDGSEIGITSVETPETTTELYLKVDDVSIDWWDIIGEVLFTDTYKTVNELYTSQLQDNPMAMQPCVQLKGDGLYVDVQDVFDSTNIIYYPKERTIQNIAYSNSGDAGGQGVDDTVVSFNMPYYVFLDKLVASINEYNKSKDVSAFSYTVGTNGHIMTYDVIAPYLRSGEFLDEGYDILALNEILQTGVNLTSYTGGMFDGSGYYDSNNVYVETGSISQMKKSRWYPSSSTNRDELTQERIEEMYAYARNWIAVNNDLLGKVPDEVFLKVFAMELAIKFNQIWGVHTADSIEIMNIDTRDLARLMVSDRASVYKYYSYGFARFVYEEAGTIGVVFAAIYFVILWITSLVKPIMMVLILGLLIINVLGRKILFRKESRCIEGYLIGAACLVSCNYLYSLMLKVTLSVAELGFGSVMAIVMALLVQIVYVAGLCFICAVEVKDWKNNGFNEFATIGSQISSGLIHASNFVTDRIVSKCNEAYNDSRRSRKYAAKNYDSTSVSDMLERDAEREDNAMNPI